MNGSDRTVDATVFLQISPEIARYYSNDSPDAIRGAKVVGSTQKRSTSPRPGTVEVKIAVRIPVAAFMPLRPEAVVVIPADLTSPHPLEVEALDANDGEGGDD